MADPILKLEGLRKSFGALKVTDDLSLDIAPSELHAIIGPNGAGKTTLIGEISGMLKPDAGRILFEGRDITAAPMHARSSAGLARSFQITTILADFTVLENVAIAVQAREGHSFRFFRPAAADETLNEAAVAALERMGLADRAAIRAGALSHGEKRRLELAVAIATGPKLLLLDEPMAGAGHEESDTLVETLKTLRSHYTIVLVEHDMRAVFALADRISVLVYGRLIATGTPEEIRRDPEVRKAYLGEQAA